MTKIIDAHMHFSNVQAFYGAAEIAGVDYSCAGYLKERAEAGIVAGVCMGLAESERFAFPDTNAATPMEADLSENTPPAFFTCLGINPYTLDAAAMQCLRNRAETDKTVVGFKIYAGYYPFYVHDALYAPVYRLAAELDMTVAIHTGVTYSERGLLEYSHPLAADRLAVQFRDTRFVLCHMGNPWIMDACEVAYKNRNVYLDISGLVEGDAQHITFTENEPLLMQHYKTGLLYLNDYKKVLFGTDWPIVPMQSYVAFCKKLIPAPAHEDVFYANAKRVYAPAALC